MNLVLFTLVALAVAAASAELAARWWMRHRSRYYVLPPGLRLKMFLDTDALPQLEPEARFEVNGDGERGGAVPRGRGLYRVLVCGGSQPEGFFLDQHTTWPGALQRILRRPHWLRLLGASQVHVGCIARSGIGSQALDLIFEKTLPRYRRLQLIIVMVGATDVMRWFEQNTPVIATPLRVSDVFRCHPEGPFGWRPSQLAVVELLRRVRRRWLRPQDVHPRAGQWLRHARAMRARATTIKDIPPDSTPMLDNFERHFRRLLQRAHEHADRVLVVKQPWVRRAMSADETARMWHGGVGQAWRENVTTYYSFSAFNRVMSQLNDRVTTVASDLDVDMLDPMPWLEQSLDTYYDGLHVTPKGARQIAMLVSSAILHIPLRQPVPAASLSHAPALSLSPERESATTA